QLEHDGPGGGDLSLLGLGQRREQLGRLRRLQRLRLPADMRRAPAAIAALAWCFLWAASPLAGAAAPPPGPACPAGPADNIWNTDISTLPVHPRSAAWLASSGATSGRLLHPDFGAPPYGVPYNVVSSTHVTANFDFLYWDESDPAVTTKQPQGPYPYG